MKIIYKSAFLLIFLCFYVISAYAQQDSEEYRKTLEMADGYFAKGDYINAKASYQIAIKMAPEDQYPKDRLQQTMGLIKVQMQQNALYAEKIMVADDLFKQKDLAGALAAYNQALQFLPGDTYATGRVNEIQQAFADAAKKEADYKASLAEGDKLLLAGNLAGALSEFKKAGSLKPDENYPKQKIADIEKLMADQKQVAGSYEKAMSDADLAIQKKKFDEAIILLESAISIKPGEQQPRDRLVEVRKMKADYETYNAIIEKADSYYISKDFEQAKAEYQKALAIKPDDVYPKSMLDKIEIALMDISKANRSSYELAIAEADKLFNQQDYDQAMIEYKNALRFKPDENYAKQRISDINNLLDLQKSQEQAYAQSIARADELFKQERYDEAKDEYATASVLRPTEQYPKVKIDEIKTIQANLQNQRQIYSSLITGADKLFFADDYEEAREQYRKASAMFPKEQYPLDQIKMINEILGRRDIYTKAITDADKLLYDKKYDEALSEYRKAAALNENEVYPQGKIYEIETIIAEQERERAIQRQYDSVVFVADDLYRSGEYVKAVEEYKKAQVISPGQGYPQLKIEEINRLNQEKAAREALDKEYTDAVAKADQLFSAKNYDAAVMAYEAAINLKPAETYPRSRLEEIGRIQAGLAAAEALDKQYAEAVAGADKLYQARDYQNALIAYQNALKLKPGEQYPAGKVSEITNLLGEMETARLALEKQYTETIAAGDKLLAAQDYEGALKSYEEAARLQPEQEYPAAKIKEVNLKIAEAAAQQELDKQYAEAITKADNYLSAKDYQNALTAYNAAADLRPAEEYPANKIVEINQIVNQIAAEKALDEQYASDIAKADKMFADKDYEGALIVYQAAANLKPSESYPSQKIKDINSALGEIAAKEALDKQYTDVIANGDRLLDAKDYKGALDAYNSALALKPGEIYPGAKIAEINNRMAEIAAKEALDKEYADAISRADQLLAAKDYQNAKAGFEAAAKLKPEETYAQGKISEINSTLQQIAAQEALDKQYLEVIASADKLLAIKDYENALIAYQSAAALKPSEPYPASRIKEINAVREEIAARAELDRQYAETIAGADKLLQDQDYQGAIAAYKSAQALKPDEKYPAGKITEATAQLDEIAAKEKKYSDAIAFGDKHLAAKDYENARKEYNTALSIKPEESYPTGKLSEINAIEEEIRKQKELDNQYNKAVAEADAYFLKELYEEARFAYQAAQKIKPAEDYPQKQLIEIGHKLEFQAQEREKAYEIAISKADNYLEQQDYAMAKVQYERAIEIKPNEVYPLDKLKLVNEQIMKQRQIIQEEYDKSIADADKYYASKLYDNAIESYKASSLLKPDEEYPKEMVRRILKMLNERSIVQINKEPLLIPNNTTHKFDFLPVPVKDRKSNYLYFRARNASEREYKLIINFGKDQAKNGGMVVKVPVGADLNEFIARISAQYKWFSEDNNWISFYPEGGDLEVQLLQISYSD